MGRALSVLVCALCLIATAGCGNDHPSLAPVSGTVSYKNEPLPGGTILLEVPGSRRATGKIVDGQITEMTTFDPNDGAPIGQARIAIFSTEATQWQAPAKKPSSPAEWTADAAPPMVSTSRIPEKYNDPKTSGLTWEIKAGENVVTLVLAE